MTILPRNLFCMRQIIETRKEKGLETYIMFIDFEKAFILMSQGMADDEKIKKWIKIVKPLY